MCFGSVVQSRGNEMKRRGGGRKGRECEKQKESWCIVDGRWYSFDDPGQVVIVVARLVNVVK